MPNNKKKKYEVELVWTGKYEELKKGKRTGFERLVLLLQKVETVNKPRIGRRETVELLGDSYQPDYSGNPNPN